MIEESNAKGFLKEMGIEITKADKEYGKIISRFSSELLVYRYENNLTQKQLAEKLGVNQPYLSKIENGEKNLSIKKLAGISAKLGGNLKITFGISKLDEDKTVHQTLKDSEQQNLRSVSGF
jgi:transcriptional regulator with XRE-family HTH domain